MISEKQYKDFYKNRYDHYSKYLHDISEFDFNNIYICDNIHEELPNFGIYDWMMEIRGATILPNTIIDDQVVLIQVSREYSFEDTSALFHELTHVYDNIQYANYYNNGVVKDFRGMPFFETYLYYSEFHAFYVADYETIRYYEKSKNSNLIDAFFSSQTDYFNSVANWFRTATINISSFIYNMFIVFGRFYTLDIYNHVESFQQSCVHSYFPELFCSDFLEIIYDLYHICWNVARQDNVFDHLAEIQNLIDDIVNCITHQTDEAVLLEKHHMVDET